MRAELVGHRASDSRHFIRRGLDPDKRSQLGAHFTAKDDILLVVEPVLMAPLRREWVTIQAQVRLLADQLGALDEAADAERTAAARTQRRGKPHRAPREGAGAVGRVPREARCRADPRSRVWQRQFPVRGALAAARP